MLVMSAELAAESRQDEPSAASPDAHAQSFAQLCAWRAALLLESPAEEAALPSTAVLRAVATAWCDDGFVQHFQCSAAPRRLRNCWLCPG